MIIHVKTVGTLKSLQEGINPVSLDLPERSSVSQIIERLGLQDWEVGFIQINGTYATKEAILKDQDQLTFTAPLAGG